MLPISPIISDVYHMLSDACHLNAAPIDLEQVRHANPSRLGIVFIQFSNQKKQMCQEIVQITARMADERARGALEEYDVSSMELMMLRVRERGIDTQLADITHPMIHRAAASLRRPDYRVNRN